MYLAEVPDSVIVGLGGLFIALITWGIRALFKLGWVGEMERLLLNTVIAVATRITDKLTPLILAARLATSEGGKKITAGEFSHMRDVALSLLLSELKGPLLVYAKGKGADVLKGLLSEQIQKLLGKFGVEIDLADTSADTKPDLPTAPVLAGAML